MTDPHRDRFASVSKTHPGMIPLRWFVPAVLLIVVLMVGLWAVIR